MILKTKINTLLLFLLCSYSYGQIDQYNYKRELQGITSQWHKVVLPEDIFAKVSPNLDDIRVFGITSTNDTIEASSILKLKNEKIVAKEMPFKILNTSHNKKGYYFTFKVLTEELINQLNLNFKQTNFDWKVTLEGSQNQQEWYTIVDDYRILSIKNSETDYHFTSINFPNTNYRFFRLLIKSNEKPDLTIAKITFNEILNGSYNNYTINTLNAIQEKQKKITTLKIDLQSTVPVSSIKIQVKDQIDYYRRLTIQYLSDSLKTENGWKYTYQTLFRGTLNSLEKNEFKFESTILKKIKINIYNNDNAPLIIDTVSIKGYVHEIITRFTVPASYYLTYGNQNTTKANYDIERFASKIKDTLNTLNLGEEQLIEKKPAPVKSPLFKNKNWLWAIMILIIIVLGWFSLKMMKKK